MHQLPVIVMHCAGSSGRQKTLKIYLLGYIRSQLPGKTDLSNHGTFGKYCDRKVQSTVETHGQQILPYLLLKQGAVGIVSLLILQLEK